MRNANAPHAYETIRAMTARCLDVARLRGWRIGLEVNNHNPHLWRVLSEIPGAEMFTDLVLLIRHVDRN